MHVFNAVATNLPTVGIRNTYNDPYHVYTMAFSHQKKGAGVDREFGKFDTTETDAVEKSESKISKGLTKILRHLIAKSMFAKP